MFFDVGPSSRNESGAEVYRIYNVFQPRNAVRAERRWFGVKDIKSRQAVPDSDVSTIRQQRS